MESDENLNVYRGVVSATCLKRYFRDPGEIRACIAAGTDVKENQISPDFSDNNCA